MENYEAANDLCNIRFALYYWKNDKFKGETAIQNILKDLDKYDEALKLAIYTLNGEGKKNDK